MRIGPIRAKKKEIRRVGEDAPEFFVVADRVRAGVLRYTAVPIGAGGTGLAAPGSGLAGGPGLAPGVFDSTVSSPVVRGRVLR